MATLQSFNFFFYFLTVIVRDDFGLVCYLYSSSSALELETSPRASCRLAAPSRSTTLVLWSEPCPRASSRTRVLTRVPESALVRVQVPYIPLPGFLPAFFVSRLSPQFAAYGSRERGLVVLRYCPYGIYLCISLLFLAPLFCIRVAVPSHS